MNSLLCPVCKAALHRFERLYRCENSHSFDIAKRGYVNLLLSQSASGHGDDKAMVQARRDFLNKGYYHSLRDALCQEVLRYAQDGEVLLDAGCGEGFYTAAVAESLTQAGKSLDVLGVDISKEALGAASKRDKRLTLAVASVFHLPVGDGSCDLLLSLFAPYCGEEFLRVLRPGGRFFMAIPLEEHLWGLKQAVYAAPYRNTVADFHLSGFDLLSTVEIRETLHLSTTADILQLFTMTPYFHKTAPSDREKLTHLSSLDTEVAFALLCYEKR